MVYYAKEIGLTKCFKENILGIKEETVTVRARNKKGHYVSDDPKTKKNEAYVTKKKTKAKKKTSTLMHP
tara:strand:+ start:68 stop:274 length:207 start_codon:yes stop_codon:yes gene_type:complete